MRSVRLRRLLEFAVIASRGMPGVIVPPNKSPCMIEAPA